MVSDLKELYEKFLQCTSVNIDSRKAVEKGMFFALKGDNFDGNAYASDALNKGCIYAVVDNPKYMIADKCILVEDTLNVLQQLSNMHRKKFEIPVLAITGTNGKTTTKEMIVRVLQKRYVVHGTHGNLNNHIGVPLTLLSMPKNTEIAVVEMGANHIGEIDFLCSLAMPDFGIITNIGKAHLEGFGSIDGVVKAKGELYDYLGEMGGTIIINKDNLLLSEMAGGTEQFSYGTSNGANVFGTLLSQSPKLVLKFSPGMDNADVICNTSITGMHNLENIMAAIGTGVKFDVAAEDIKEAVESYVPGNNRSQVIKTKTNKLLLDAYNANPMNMKASLENFSQLDGFPKVVILGDMLELGKYSDEEHLEIIRLLKKHGFDKAILVGSNFSKAKDQIPCLHFSNASEVALWLDVNPIEGSLVLLKGSRGIGLEILAEKL